MLNVRLSIFFCLSSLHIYHSLGISLSFWFATASALFCCTVLENCVTFVIFHYYTILISVHQKFHVFLLEISELFCCQCFEAFIFLSVILLPVKSLVTSAVFFCFLNDSFWRSSKCICCRFFRVIKKFLALFPT